MNTEPHVVILITIAALAVGCETRAPREPGPLERAASIGPTLTSSSATPPAEDADIDAPADQNKSIYEPTLQSGDGISIHRLITASDIQGREPLSASSIFGDDEEKVYAFLELSNESPEGRTVTVFFIGPSGKISGGVELEVPANVPRWRTWAYTRFADELGLWRVEVRSSAGVLLGALPFEVAEGC
ncbi:MAG: DUF2914 domain-containing protein [Myxococcales bacterium]|jgi:hypothetical protein|nr:DUF2914 domain-containing protein [Myxococcales bacterium]MDH3842832.1 DUF2914 domain-containing protein [Myxococcales bacterium]